MKRQWLGATAAAAAIFLGGRGEALGQGANPPVEMGGIWLLTVSGSVYDAQGAKSKLKESALVPFTDGEGDAVEVGSFGAGALAFPAAAGGRQPNAVFVEGPGVSLALAVKVDPASGRGRTCKGIATWGAGGSVGILKIKGKRVLDIGPPATIFACDFEGGLAPYVETDPAGAPAETLWHAEGSCAAGSTIPASMGSSAAAYNRGDEAPPVYTYNTGSLSPNAGALEGPPLPIPPAAIGVTIRFDMLQETEGQPAFFDQAFLEAKRTGDPVWEPVVQLTGIAGCGEAPISVTIGPSDPVLGGTIGHGLVHRFRFDTVDSGVNNHLGWYVDNVEVVVLTSVSVP